MSDKRRALELSDLLRTIDTVRTAIACGPDLLGAAQNAARNGWITQDEAEEVLAEIAAQSAIAADV